MNTGKKNILIVNKYFDMVGGIEEVVRQLATINDPDVSITVLALGDPADISGIEKYYPNARIVLLPIAFTRLSMPVSFQFFRVFLQELRKADVVHIHSPFPLAEWYYVFLNFFTSFSSKLVVTWHADIIKQKFFIRLHHWFLHRLFKASAAIAVTSPLIIQYSDVLQPFLSKVKTIPLGVNGGENVSRTNFSYALFVGRLIYYKGVTYLLDALAGTDIHLVVVGEGPLVVDLIDQATRNGISAQITWKGRVSDEELRELYKNASLFVFPSIAITEALGLVQAEAMSYGLPVINTNLPTGVPWVARDGKEAITVPVGETLALRDALLKLRNNTTLRNELGTNARERYEEFFRSETMIQKYVELYKEIA